MKTKNISRIISLLLTLIMIFGTLPTVAFAEAEAPDAQSTQPAAEQIKFYNNSGSKVTKTLKSEGTYKKDNKLVAEYANGVLDLYDYNGGRIEARGGSLTVRVHGTNTIQVDLLNNGISILEQKPDKANEKVYALKITGADDNAALHFVVNPAKKYVSNAYAYDGCFDIDGTKHTYISLENLTIKTEHNETEQNEYDLYQNGIIDLIRNCKVNLYYGTIRADLVENSELTTSGSQSHQNSFLICGNLLDSTVNVTDETSVYVALKIENSAVTGNAQSVSSATVDNSIIRAIAIKTNKIIDCTIDAASIENRADAAITIDNSIVNIKYNRRNWSAEGSSGILNECNRFKRSDDERFLNMDEPSIIIRNKSKITIDETSDGITTYGCGILIDNSEVTMRTEERGFRISPGKSGTECATMYGLHITGKSKVKVDAAVDYDTNNIHNFYAGIEYIGDQITSELSDGNYAAAFSSYAALCDDFITQANTDKPYDRSNLPAKPLSLIWIPVSLVIGFVIAKIVVGNMKSKLKTVRSQTTANSYVKNGSMQITDSRDLFLYHTVAKTAKPKNTSSGSSGTHTSSSGTTHGGGGGKF